MKLNKMVFDDKKIEAAANKHIETEYARYFVGKDCEMLVFDKAEGVSCDINETTSDGDYVFLHISSDKYTTKTPE